MKYFVAKKFVKRRQLERVVGLINFAWSVDPIHQVCLKKVNRHMRKAANVKLSDTPFPLSFPLKISLPDMLETEVLSQKVIWTIPPLQVEVYTDAYMSGWNFHTLNGIQKQGVWSNPFLHCHISTKEMVVIWIALRSLQLAKRTSIWVHSDNKIVICCLNRGWSSRSIPLWSWTLSIVSLLESRGWFLTTVHVKGINNILASTLSRDRPIAKEIWTVFNGFSVSLWDRKWTCSPREKIENCISRYLPFLTRRWSG